MAIYAISDLHLSFGTNKPMEIFGWKDYEEKIKQDWIAKVKQDDLVLLPGDFSWAMRLEDTYQDFEFLNKLPGIKLLLKGNHDYWWTTITKMRNYIKEQGFENIDFIYNNSYEYEDYVIAGTRGWILTDESAENKKILNREVERLRLSLEDAKQYGQDKKKIVCMHYPPLKEKNEISPFVKLMEEYQIDICIYGHLHGVNQASVIEGKCGQITYQMVSCDYTNFQLIQLEI